MAYTQTNYYDAIIERQIRSGRASNKTEVVHQALEILDAITRGKAPAGCAFDDPEELKAMLLAGFESGPAQPMTDERWAKICGR